MNSSSMNRCKNTLFFLLQQKIVLELSAVTVSFKKKCYICPLKPSYREI